MVDLVKENQTTVSKFLRWVIHHLLSRKALDLTNFIFTIDKRKVSTVKIEVKSELPTVFKILTKKSFLKVLKKSVFKFSLMLGN